MIFCKVEQYMVGGKVLGLGREILNGSILLRLRLRGRWEIGGRDKMKGGDMVGGNRLEKEVFDGKDGDV